MRAGKAAGAALTQGCLALIESRIRRATNFGTKRENVAVMAAEPKGDGETSVKMKDLTGNGGGVDIEIVPSPAMASRASEENPMTAFRRSTTEDANVAVPQGAGSRSDFVVRVDSEIARERATNYRVRPRPRWPARA